MRDSVGEVDKTLRWKILEIFVVALLSVGVLFLLLSASGCGSKGPTNEQAEQAIQEYLKNIRVFSDYRGPYEIKIIQVGEQLTAGIAPNEFPVWPVKASVSRALFPAMAGIEKVFVVGKNAFGEWYCPEFFQP